ncbi:hypothetical protein M9H77_18360 [Catharanthus roseus]|uniref:Uncharacterized protein n=1 Tax=Catharanthus roseus TaxID=4058 RepID=A0ACC0B774_CATRO|nr:hypothetical protein M9H77_18360 [Catharanthus roseus]
MLFNFVYLDGRRGDADLDPVTNRTGRVEGRPVTALSRAAPQDSSCSTHGYSHAEYGVSSSDPYGNRVVGEEQERVRSLHIQGEADERGDDDGDGSDDDGGGGDDDQDDGDDDGDEEHTVFVALVVPASGSDRRPRHGKGKGLTGSFMSVMSKFVGSRNKRPEVARDVTTPTQKMKKDCGLLKCRSRYMAFTVYSCPPYPASGGTPPAEQQDVRLEEHFCRGTVARGTFALTDRVMD